jgi:hypothetical protein
MTVIDKTDEKRCFWLNKRAIMTDLRKDNSKLRGK